VTTSHTITWSREAQMALLPLLTCLPMPRWVFLPHTFISPLFLMSSPSCNSFHSFGVTLCPPFLLPSYPHSNLIGLFTFPENKPLPTPFPI
jgi:hypothetical protein